MKPSTQTLLLRTGIALALLVACLGAEPAYWQVRAVPLGSALEAERTAILTAVLRDVSSIRDAQGVPWRVFCVEVLGGDPSPRLLAHLADLADSVAPISTCATRDDHGTLRVPENGLVLRVTTEPEFRSGGLAKLSAGDHLGNMAATEYEYILARAWGRWWIVRRTLRWLA